MSSRAVRELQKKYKEAIVDYSKAIELDGNMAAAYYNCGRLWATCPDSTLRDSKRAVASATKACELTRWERADCLDVLAASYASSGDFAAATKWQAKANARFIDVQDRRDGERGWNFIKVAGSGEIDNSRANGK